MCQGHAVRFLLCIGLTLLAASGGLTMSVVRCPSVCQCSSEYYVYCQSSGISDDQLTQVIADVSPNAVLLDLSLNRLTVLPRGIFRTLPHLERLNIASNRISNIDEGAFDGLPRLYELNLRGNIIRDVSNASFQGLAGLKDLHLGGNLIPVLPPNVFINLTSLEKLHLQRNLITDLAPKTFLGLGRLQRLNLSQNLLKSISGLTFSGLASLKKLTLTDNEISDFSVDAFRGVANLEELHLQKNAIKDLHFMVGNDFYSSLSAVNFSYNLITAVPSHVFPNNQNLKRVDLSFNSIRHMGGQSFSGLYLDSLQLQGNNLTELTHEALDGAKRILELSLGSNRIGDVSTGAFDSFRETVLILDLHGNLLTSLHSGMFRGMRRLRALDLAKNEISGMEPGSFRDLEKLEELNLSGNKLSSLSSDMIAGPAGLRKLLLVCNPLRKLTRFVYDDVGDRIYIETNSTAMQSADTAALISWPYTEGSQLYWTVTVACITSSAHCRVPAYESTLRPYVTRVTLTDLTPAAEYYVCVSPVFLSTEVNVSQCVHIRTQRATPEYLRQTSTSGYDSVRNSARLSPSPSFHTVYTLLLIAGMIARWSSPS